MPKHRVSGQQEPRQEPLHRKPVRSSRCRHRNLARQRRSSLSSSYVDDGNVSSSLRGKRGEDP